MNPQSPSSSSSSEAHIRAVLKQCLRWHNGDKYREDPDEANRAAWEDHKHLLENTLASLAATPPSLPIDFKQASEQGGLGGDAGVSDDDAPSAKQQKLYELADRIDHERLCLRPGMTHRDMTPEQRDRMNAGVELRRYARIWKADRWIIVPPVGPVQFSASTLDAAYEMAKKDEVRNATAAASKAAEKSGRSAPKSAHPEEGALLLGGEEGGKA